jgi:HEAT repeat protein
MRTQLFAATIQILSYVVLVGGLADAAQPGAIAMAGIDQALHAKNPDTRREAVRALALIGSKPPYRERLESMLNDKDAQVRVAVVGSLAEVGDAKALRVALDDSTPEVRLAAAKALFEMNDPAARVALIKMLKGDAKTASNFMGREERDGRHTLETPKPLMLTAVRYSGALAPVPGAGIGIALVLKAMSKPGASNRAAIALLLAGKKDPDVVAALEQALTDKDAVVRAAAIQAIAMLDDPAFARDAELMLNDKNQAVRLRAAACYLRLSSLGVRGSSTVIRSWQD